MNCGSGVDSGQILRREPVDWFLSYDCIQSWPLLMMSCEDLVSPHTTDCGLILL